VVCGQSVASVGGERQTELTLFDAAYERRPSVGEGNDKTVRMVAVPPRPVPSDKAPVSTQLPAALPRKVMRPGPGGLIAR
jgi:hypothetical protein